MKYAPSVLALALVAALATACAFDQGGYPSDDQRDPGTDMGTPDPTNVDPQMPDAPDPTTPTIDCQDDDGDGYFAGSDCDVSDDCNDDDDNAHPGQTMFFEDRARGGDYDYNCDGSEERALTVEADPRKCISGWKRGTPRCGDEKDYIQCEADGDDEDECTCDTIKVVQPCR